MKRVLIDENIHQGVYKLFPDFDAKPIGFMKWNCIANGKLFSIANDLFDVLLTADQNLPYQQSLVGKIIAAVVLHSGRLEHIMPLVETIKSTINEIQPGSFVYLARIQ
jgi:hypothetical protein